MGPESEQTARVPQDLDAERLVLGALIFGPEEYDQSYLADVQDLRPEDFSLERHRIIFQRIKDLEHRGEPIGPVLVYRELEKRSETGGDSIEFLGELHAGLPNYPSVKRYAELIREAAALREAMLVGQSLIAQSSLGTDAAELVEATRARLARIRAGKPATGMESAASIIEAHGVTAFLESRKHRGLVLPWPKLDYGLAGFGPGQLIVLMAATSKGKTSMALQIVAHAMTQKVRSAIWTMEMSPKSLISRMIVQDSKVFSGKEYTTSYERRQQAGAVQRIIDTPPLFDQSSTVPAFLANFEKIRADVGLVIVDHLQLIRSGSRNRAQEVSENSRALKLAAMEYGVPILVLSQVDRSSVKGDGKIGLHSGKESGDIENDADVMMWIDAPELDRYRPTLVSLHIGKQREGPAGFNVPMTFDPISQTFAEAGVDA